MTNENFVALPDSKYGDGILLEEYNGTMSLVRAFMGNEGEPVMKWCFPQGKDRQPGPKGLPWRIELGSPEHAVEVLRHFLGVLTGQASQASPQQQSAPVEPPDDDIPF